MSRGWLRAAGRGRTARRGSAGWATRAVVGARNARRRPGPRARARAQATQQGAAGRTQRTALTIRRLPQVRPRRPQWRRATAAAGAGEERAPASAARAAPATGTYWSSECSRAVRRDGGVYTEDSDGGATDGGRGTLPPWAWNMGLTVAAAMPPPPRTLGWSLQRAGCTQLEGGAPSPSGAPRPVYPDTPTPIAERDGTGAFLQPAADARSGDERAPAGARLGRTSLRGPDEPFVPV